MTANIPADILAEMKGRDRVHSVFEIDLSSTLKFGDGGAIAEDTLGVYAPRIVSLNLPERTANTVEFSFELGRATVSIHDKDRVLQKEHGGPFADGVEGQAARVKLVSPAAEPWTQFDGIVTNYGIQQGQDGDIYTYELAHRVQELDARLKLPLFSRELFPLIPTDVVDTDIVMPWGEYKSSADTGSSGMLKLTPIGESDVWVLSIGRVESIDAIWVNGTKHPAADWVEFQGFARGNDVWNGVRFINAGIPASSDTVTADVRGITDSPGDSTGAMITNPITILRTILAKFVYGDGATLGISSWPSETSLPLATAILDAAETFYDTRNGTASLTVNSSDTARSVITKIAKDWNAPPFFTIDGKLALRPEDNAETDIYADADHHIIQFIQHLRNFGGMETQRGAAATTLRFSRVLNRATNSFAITTEVADRDVTREILAEFQMETSRASVF